MLHPFPSLSSVRAFEAAARLGNFAAAAREMGTSAASVSYHVQQLERQIDSILFQRFPQRVQLTPAGMLLAKETAAVFSALRNAFAAAAELDQTKLVLTALPTFGTSWLVPRLGTFRAAHPDIRIEIDLSPAPADLAGGAYDAAIRNGHGRWPGLHATKLFPSIFTPLCAPHVRKSIAWTKRGDVSDGIALLGRPDWWSKWRRALNNDAPLEPERFGMSFTDEHLDAAAAIAGHGVAIGSPVLFRAEIDAGRLVPAHDLVVGDGRAFWFTYPISRRRNTKIACFQTWLKHESAAACSAARRFIEKAIVVKEL